MRNEECGMRNEKFMNTNMNTTTPRPTPETDAFILANAGFGPTDYQWREHSRDLERERDEAREALSGRTVSCSQCNKTAKQFEAMERAKAEQARRADENREWALRAERERDEARIHFRRTIDELADEQQAHGLTKGKLTECQMEMAAMREVVAAAEKCRHWHDCSYNPETGETEGVVISANSFWALHNALAKLQPFLP